MPSRVRDTGRCCVGLDLWAADSLGVTASELHVVTGGGTGMGRDIALRLAAQGQTVVIVGRREEPLRQTAAAARGRCIEVVVADVSTVEGARSLVAAIGDRAVTGMVAAAGGTRGFG